MTEIIKPYVPLLGEDGNATAIVGRTRTALRRAGNSQEVVDGYVEEALSGSYDHVLATTLSYTTQEPPPPPPGDAEALEQALLSLKDIGIDARPNFLCCGSCAVSAIASESGEDADFAYWHAQDDEGAFPWEEEVESCYGCGGTGDVDCEDCHGDGEYEDGEECESCDGTGNRYCDFCDGNGETREEATERSGSDLIGDLYIGYGGKDEERAKEVGQYVVAAIEAVGYTTEWDGDSMTRIKVKAQ
jgi:hypothetical protein